LFPLQTVLYPHCILPLHIFEPRYRTMIKMCIEHEVPFGVVQVANGQVEIDGEHPRNYEIGTVAKITNVIEFADGRMFINTSGGKRFRILESAYDADVLTARVETYSDEPSDSAGLLELRDAVMRDFLKYWQLLECVMNRDLGQLELPDDATVLSFLIPSVLHVQPELKQALLQKRTARERLELIQELLDEENEKLRDAMRDGREK
jgi:Lon protease-like protein